MRRRVRITRKCYWVATMYHEGDTAWARLTGYPKWNQAMWTITLKVSVEWLKISLTSNQLL